MANTLVRRQDIGHMADVLITLFWDAGCHDASTHGALWTLDRSTGIAP
jgi:hypothetical protein